MGDVFDFTPEYEASLRQILRKSMRRKHLIQLIVHISRGFCNSVCTIQSMFVNFVTVYVRELVRVCL